jgi:hypothetical protein
MANARPSVPLGSLQLLSAAGQRVNTDCRLPWIARHERTSAMSRSSRSASISTVSSVDRLEGIHAKQGVAGSLGTTRGTVNTGAELLPGELLADIMQAISDSAQAWADIVDDNRPDGGGMPLAVKYVPSRFASKYLQTLNDGLFIGRSNFTWDLGG